MRSTGRRISDWTRKCTDASGRVHLTPGAKHDADLALTQDRELAAKKAANASAVGFDNAQNFFRAEERIRGYQRVAEERLTGTPLALALDPINRANVALHTPNPNAPYAFTDLATDRGKAGGVRQFVGLAPENRPTNRQEPAVITTFWQKVQAYMDRTGTKDTAAAIKACEALFPEDARRNSAEHNAAVDRVIGAPSTQWTEIDEKQLDALVQRRAEKTGETYAAALMVLARENRDLFDRRTRALSLPVGPGGVALTNR